MDRLAMICFKLVDLLQKLYDGEFQMIILFIGLILHG